MPPAEFETAISVGERPQPHVFPREEWKYSATNSSVRQQMRASEEFASDKSLTTYRLEIKMGPEKAWT